MYVRTPTRNLHFYNNFKQILNFNILLYLWNFQIKHHSNAKNVLPVQLILLLLNSK